MNPTPYYEINRGRGEAFPDMESAKCRAIRVLIELDIGREGTRVEIGPESGLDGGDEFRHQISVRRGDVRKISEFGSRFFGLQGLFFHGRGR